MPKAVKKFEVLVLGSGMAGIPAMRAAAQALKKNTAAVIGTELGGTCLNFGCIPKKALYHIAHLVEEMDTSAKYGFSVQKQFDFSRAMQYKEAVIKRLGGLRRESMEDWGVTLFDGVAKFISPTVVELNDGERLTADKIIIATGGQPIMPRIAGIGHAITSKEVLSLPKLPESMLVVGTGYIGMEFASIYSALGTKVIAVSRGPEHMSNLSRDAAETVQKYLENKGVEFLTDSELTKIDSKQGSKQAVVKTPSGEKTFEVEEVLVAIGRKPDTKELGLDKAGVELDEQGFIKTNKFYQTTQKNIYAVGDVIGEPQLTAKANYDGDLAVLNAYAEKPTPRDYSVVSYVEYTMPVSASVGVIKSDGDTGFMKVPYNRLPAGNATGKIEGYIKLFFNRKTDQIVGGEIVGEHADELINSFAFAVKAKMTREQVNEVLVFHPSFAEGLKFASRGEIIGHQDDKSCCG